MKTPFDYLVALLERLHARSPVAAYFVALAIAAVCMLALAYLNADGSAVGALPGVHA
ncbi:hypothetical protein [Paraburkholderia caballeronis]|uniref:hypothetical protein n=1 Tax=Paraburkholderia caballeronis TaxID=416943 RepID=UPI001417026D|nr:hypothetical protein [Paraburkholderia caballeronis]